MVLLFLLSSGLFSAEGCPPHELKALLTLRSTLNDTAGMLESWKGDDCCTWNGIKCSENQDGRHVSKLDLRDFGLESVNEGIDSSLFELRHLSYLDLSGNSFPGEIPSQLGMLFSLRHLHLQPFPSSCVYDVDGLYFWFCTDVSSSNLHWLSHLSSLEYLTLSYIDVRDKNWGSIIGSLLHLKYLDMSRCNLSAPTIPSNLLNLSTLVFLDLSHNILTNMPNSFGELYSLTHLDLAYNSMLESIPNTIRNLTKLEYLDLSFNALTGQIPLTDVEYLDLSCNALTGQIPLSLCHNHGCLSHLILEQNNLEGTIPSSLGLHINLTVLRLGYNQLSGNVPASLGNLHRLKILDLSDNDLSGSLPLSLAHLSSLTYLLVSDSHLNGSIPYAMLPSSVEILDLSNNNMNETITEVFFQKCLKLRYLGLSNSGLSINISSTLIPSFQLEYLRLKKCQIGGPIPSWISTQFSLNELDLSANQLVGNLPSWLWDIDEVHLSDNQLQGSFTPTAGSLSYLNLSMNELSGSLPADIHVRLSNAEVLILADNKFEGQIPASIANLRNLRFLDISTNSLMGKVPATLGNFTQLEVLNLGNNYLEGEIPKELGSLSYLQSLRMGKNSLQGILPSSLTNFSWLQVLDVGGNNLVGNIPIWIANVSCLHVLVLRSNNFRGNLPPEIGGMPKLQVLVLSSNLFLGVIPHSYLRLPAMQNSSTEKGLLEISTGEGFHYTDSIDLVVKGHEMHYEYVLSSLACFDLSNNRLTGPLPPEVENLKGLMFLNLSMNHLSGPIPESIGNLVHLESVDLFFNNFSGRIPSQLGNLTFLAHLNLSHNNLWGRIPQEGGQMLTFDESSFIENPNLWGCPLERNCSRPDANAGASPPTVGVEQKKEEGFEFPWFWMSFGLSWGVGFSVVVIVLEFNLSWTKKCKKCFEAMDRGIEMVIKAKTKPRWAEVVSG